MFLIEFLKHIDENGVSRVVSRRDMATQMSPVSSPETYTPPPVEGVSHHSSRSEVRDVQVDKGVTITKKSKRHKMKVKKNNRVKESNNELSLTWNTTEGAMKLSKYLPLFLSIFLSLSHTHTH